MNRKLWQTVCFGIALMALTVMAGCGGGGPETQYVEGKVTLDGTPVQGVVVSFSPTDANGVPAVGTTDAAGVYKLNAVGGGEIGGGTAPGPYNVSFKKTTVVGAGPSEHQEGAEETGSGGLSAPPEVKSEIPAAYGDPKTSGVSVTVKPGENKGGEFDFDLKSAFAGQ